MELLKKLASAIISLCLKPIVEERLNYCTFRFSYTISIHFIDYQIKVLILVRELETVKRLRDEAG